MPWFKYGVFLQRCDRETYDEIHAPLTAAPHSGIYQCVACMREIVAAEGQTLESAERHYHPEKDSPTGWRLLVYADPNPKWAGILKFPVDMASTVADD